MLRKLIFLTAFMSLMACAILHPKTDAEKAKALHWCNGAEWVLGVTDEISIIACSSIGTIWSRAGCMAYQFSSGLLKFQIQQVRLVVSTVSEPVELKVALSKAQATFQKIDEVYQGESPL